MRYNTLSTLSTFLLSVIMSCTPLPPRPSIQNCTVDSDCILVTVDNGSNDNQIDVRLNNVKLGDLNGYDHGTYTYLTTNLRNGPCATAVVRFVLSASRVSSNEECIHSGQYFHILISNHPRYVFLTPLPL